MWNVKLTRGTKDIVLQPISLVRPMFISTRAISTSGRGPDSADGVGSSTSPSQSEAGFPGSGLPSWSDSMNAWRSGGGACRM